MVYIIIVSRYTCDHVHEEKLYERIPIKKCNVEPLRIRNWTVHGYGKTVRTFIELISMKLTRWNLNIRSIYFNPLKIENVFRTILRHWFLRPRKLKTAPLSLSFRLRKRNYRTCPGFFFLVRFPISLHAFSSYAITPRNESGKKTSLITKLRRHALVVGNKTIKRWCAVSAPGA